MDSHWMIHYYGKSISKQIASSSIKSQCRIGFTFIEEEHPFKNLSCNVWTFLPSLTSNQNRIFLLNLSIWSHRTLESDEEGKPGWEKILNLSLIRSSREGKTRGSLKIVIGWECLGSRVRIGCVFWILKKSPFVLVLPCTCRNHWPQRVVPEFNL